MDIIYSGLTLLKEMNWFISSFIYIPQSTIFQEFIVNESIKWNIYQKWKLIEMTSKEKLSTNLHVNIFNTGFFLIHENWSVLMLMKWQLYDKNVTIYCPEYFCMLFISDTVIISCGYVFQRNVLLVSLVIIYEDFQYTVFITMHLWHLFCHFFVSKFGGGDWSFKAYLTHI